MIPALVERLREQPLTIAEVMTAAAAAYYARGDVFGSDGDFVTAPEISAVFGELIGLWCAVTWQQMGRPRPFRLVECGPGRGTLMVDLLHAAARVSGFVDSADIHLIEHSATLRALQKRALGDVAATWHDTLADVPHGPMLLIANEFVDALPVHQFVKYADGWRERHVTIDPDNKLSFIDLPCTAPATPFANVGDVLEISPAATHFAAEVGARVGRDGGAALVIDYGNAGGIGDTLQAVSGHRYHAVHLGQIDVDLLSSSLRYLCVRAEHDRQRE